MNKILSILLFLSGCATIAHDNSYIKPVYPQMDECPELPQATQETFAIVTTITVPAMYYKCKADHDMARNWIILQENKNE